MGRDVSTFGRLRSYFVIKNRQIAAVRLLNAELVSRYHHYWQ